MALKDLKRGEKVILGVVALLFVFSAISFAVMEVIRHNMDKPMYGTYTHYDFSADGLKGSELFEKSRCTSCHRAMRNGTNMGLDLDGLGSKRTPEYIYNFLKNPEATYPSRTLDHGIAPKEAAYVSEMSDQDLKYLTVFLSELKADTGSAAARMPDDVKSGFIDEMVKLWAPESWKSEFKDIRNEVQSDSKGK